MVAVKIFAVAGVFALVISCSQPEKGPTAILPSILQGKDPSLVALVRSSIVAANREPENPESWLELGYVYEANSLDSLALVAYDRALAVNHTNARAWYRTFVVAHRQRDQERAYEANSRLLELAPNYAPVHIRAGYWHLDLGRSSEAGLSFQRAVELDSGNPGGHWGLARIMMLENEPDRASELLEQLVRRRPDDPYSYQLLGTAYRQAGRWQEAERVLEKGQNGGKVWPDPWHEEVEKYETGLWVDLKRVRAYIAQGASRVAVVDLQHLRQLHPESIIVLKMLGKTLLRTEQWERALDVFNQAQSKSPDDAGVVQGIASVYFGMGEVDKAMSQLELALAIDSTLASAHAGRGSILMQLRQLPQAALAFQTAARFEPDDPSHLVQLGMVQCDLRQWGEGRTSFMSAVAIDSTQYEGYLGWAVAERNLGNLRAAEEALLRAEALKPESKTVKSLLQTVRRQRSDSN
jgi:tetratricopeptide (TPR) repeat protein